MDKIQNPQHDIQTLRIWALPTSLVSWVPCPIPFPSLDLLNDLKLPVILGIFISSKFSCSCSQPSYSVTSFLLTSASTEERIRCFHNCVVIDCLLFSVSTRLQAPQGQVSCLIRVCHIPSAQLHVQHIVVAKIIVLQSTYYRQDKVLIYLHTLSPLEEQNKIRLSLEKECGRKVKIA